MCPADTNLPATVPDINSAPTDDVGLAKPNALVPVAPVSPPTSLSDIKAEDIKNGPFLEGDAALKRDAILEAARKLNLHSIDITYDGAGDEGTVESVTAFIAHEAADTPASPPLTECPPSTLLDTDHIVPRGGPRYENLHELAQAFAWDLLGQHYGGFENNEGAYGTITIDIASGKVKVEHNDQYIATEYSEAEF